MNSPASNSAAFAWPNNARIAVVVTCLLENWSGDKGPPFSVQTTALKPGTHDRAAMSWGRYGSRTGVWRLLKILNANDVAATFCANAQSMEIGAARRRPDAAFRPRDRRAFLHPGRADGLSQARTKSAP